VKLRCEQSRDLDFAGAQSRARLPDYGEIMNDSGSAASEDDSVDSDNEDRFISLQIIPLLLLPGIVIIISNVLYVCGLNSEQVQVVRDLYINPVLLLSLATGFVVPILFLIFIAYLGIMNIVRHHRKKTITVFTMIGLNIFAFVITYTVDVNYLRFMVKKHEYESQIHNAINMADDDSKLFVFDFDSEAIIVFDESDEISKPEWSRSTEWRAKSRAFPILGELGSVKVGSVKSFGGHYYFTSTAVF
jgi:hypothetical protein